MTTVYLSGPIAGEPLYHAAEWRNYIKERWPGCLDPLRHDISQVTPAVIEQDKEDIRNCDVFLMWCIRPSWGTPMELMYAHELEKYIIVINQIGALSPWVLYHATVVVGGLDDALKEIRKFDAARF